MLIDKKSPTHVKDQCHPSPDLHLTPAGKRLATTPTVHALSAGRVVRSRPTATRDVVKLYFQFLPKPRLFGSV